MKVKKKTNGSKDKGKAFRSSLCTSKMNKDVSATSALSRSDSTTRKEKKEKSTGQSKIQRQRTFNVLQGSSLLETWKEGHSST